MSRQSPQRQGAFFERLSVRGSACVRIAFGCRQDRDSAFTTVEAAQSAIPKTDVALPGFKIALCRNDERKLFARFALERRQYQRARWTGNQSADRNDMGAAVDLIEHTTKFIALDNPVQRVMKN